MVRHHSKEQHISKKESLKCMYCSKMFIRSYNLRRHSKKCPSKSGKQPTHDRDRVLFQMRFNQHQFLSQLELGGLVSNLLVEHDDLSEHSLTEENRTALRLHRQYQIPHMSEFENAILKPWQEEVMTFINQFSKREVIWIVGKKGKEGKTFLQDYIKYYHGERRVIATDITGHKKNIAHFLGKCALACKDIFLFNHPCSTTDSVAYDLLEGIKDGRILSHKYNTDQLHFNTPNTVIVFSNHHPNRDALKKDRWRVYEIRADELVKVSEKKVKPILRPTYFDKHTTIYG